MHLPLGTTLSRGRYEILRYINSGGFGCTYEARDTNFKNKVRTVAVKEFFVKDFCNRDIASNSVVVATQSKVELVEKLRNKFIDEAEALYELQHSGIVRVTDKFEENNTAYYVMDFINGKPLSALVEERGALAESEALGYIRQIADALKFVHAHNRLHLDVKPQNIMVDNDGKAVLIDFGVSKQYDEVNGENTSTLVGCTPGYAPIEQSGSGVSAFTPATDIYALGATLYKLLSGETPVPAHQRASSIRLKELKFSDSITAATRRAVEGSMQLYVDNRPQSIDEFIALLSENENIETAGRDSEETVVGVNSPPPLATPSFEEVGELSKAASFNDDETLLNSSSTLGGEESRSDGGENELSKVKTENAKNYTASSGNEETLLNSENGVDDATLHTESVSVLQIDKPSFKEENEENKGWWKIPLFLLSAWFLFAVAVYEEQAEPEPEVLSPATEYEQIVAEPESEALSPAAEYEQKVVEPKSEALSSAAGYENGYGYVDLGLSVKWATYNVGANSPEEYGNLYDWDESQLLGTGNWRLPTEVELSELYGKCNWEWTIEKGVYGYKVSGPNGNSIFLPAAGFRHCSGNVNIVRACGFYWSSSPKDSENTWILGFNSDCVIVSGDSRCNCYSVRLVQD